MTFIVDGTNGATFPDSTTQTTALTTGAVTKSMISTSSSTGLGICRAWANYNGVTPALNGNYNVSSVTKASTGQYQFNFTTAMPNANYSTTLGALSDVTPPFQSSVATRVSYVTSQSTTSVTINTGYQQVGYYGYTDFSIVNIAVFST